jgi:hypothetical protein
MPLIPRFRRLRIVRGVLIGQHYLYAGMHLEFPTNLPEIVAHGFRLRIEGLGDLSGFEETTAFARFRLSPPLQDAQSSSLP